ncbi:uncharacterized protein DUF1983 [Enterobacter sp. AG326]|nr:uncharacterized protein DUF1983 [Enterobacter sp. AG326]
MALELQLIKHHSGILIPATPETSDILQSKTRLGDVLVAEFRRVRNPAFHRRFFALLNLGFEYWEPTGGAISSNERKLITGYAKFLASYGGNEGALIDAAEQYLEQVAYTDWIRGVSNDNADDYLGEIADDFLTSADGDRLTSDIDTNLEAAMQNALANHGTVEHQWAQYGEVRADILVVKTTIAEVDRAMAEMSTQVQAQIDNVTASLEDKLTAVVDASGASAIYTLKTGVRINGVMYNAGMSIAVLAEAGKPVE